MTTLAPPLLHLTPPPALKVVSMVKRARSPFQIDLNELLALSDRIQVINWKFVYASPIEQANVTNIGHKMAGH